MKTIVGGKALVVVLLAVGCMVWLAGCYRSVVPWWPVSRWIEMPGLEGRWVSESDHSRTYEIKRLELNLTLGNKPARPPKESKAYLVVKKQHGREIERWAVVFARFGKTTGVDVCDATSTPNSFAVAGHGLYVVSLQGRDLQIFSFSDEAMKAALAHRGVGMTEDDNSNIILARSERQLEPVVKDLVSRNPLPVTLLEHLRKVR